MRLTLGIWSACLLIAPALCNAQASGGTGSIQYLDLAAPVSSVPVPAGTTVRVVIVNRLPQHDYQVSVERQFKSIEPFESPLGSRGAVDCSTLIDEFLAAIHASAAEKDLPAKIADFRRRAAACGDDVAQNLEGEIRARTQIEVGNYVLRRGELLVVSVQRSDTKWMFTLTTGARGEWRTFYGFTFLPNEDEDWFSQPVAGSTDQFTITREADRESFDFAPSVLFTWLPASQRGTSWSHGLTAGLGFDLDNPIVFGGYAVVFNENIALTGGVVMHKRSRLSGRYESGQTIGENLSAEQLSESTYGANWYVGIAFRFGSNPFDRDE